MKHTEKNALDIAKSFAELLGLEDKEIKIIFGPEHPIGSAGVRLLKDCIEVEDTEDFDTIEITLFDISEFKLSGWLENVNFHSMICHEMVHAKYPQWSEDKVADYASELIGFLMKKLEEKYSRKS